VQLEAEDVEDGDELVEPDRRFVVLDLADEALGDPRQVGDVDLEEPERGAARADLFAEIHGHLTLISLHLRHRHDRAALESVADGEVLAQG